MTVVDMKKLLLVGNNKERASLMKKLHKLGCVEVVSSKKIEAMDYFGDQNSQSEISQKIANLEFLLDFFKRNATRAAYLDKKKLIKYSPKKSISILQAKPSLTFEEFSKSNQYDKEVFEIVDKLKDFSSQLLDIKTERAKNKNIIAQFSPFINLQKPLDFYKSTKNTTIYVGICSNSAVEKLQVLKDLGTDYQYFDGKNVLGCVVAVVANENAEKVSQTLGQIGINLATFDQREKAQTIIENASKQLEQLDAKEIEIVEHVTKLENIIPTAKLLYDYYLLEARKLECEGYTTTTQSCFYLEAWLPAFAQEKVEKELDDSALTLAFVIREPLENEVPPTLAINNGVVAPYEDVTNMFSAPQYQEIDPNPFVAFFFFLFFGMMLSDAGYGLMLTLASGVVLAITRPPKGQSNLIKIMFMGGISTLGWGIVFGSYFGVSAADLGIWYWFNPIEKPMNMLILSLAMGIFQMCFGIGINMVALFKQHKPFQAICSAFSWYFLIIGLAMVALGGKIAIVKTLGWVMLALGLAMLLIAGTFGKKGFGKVSGAFSNVYGIVNFFSDLMSYTRIFGLGLATAVIGMVFNQIGLVIMNLMPVKFLGWIAFAIIAIIGHVFNLGINALGSYVHNSRLQFVEFFGKFYNGGGRLMRPLGSEMKYYYIKEEPKEVK